MSLTQLTTTIMPTTAANIGGNAGLFTALQAWLLANPAIIIQDVDWYRPISPFAAELQRIRIVYLQAASGALGNTYQAYFYQGNATAGDATTQFNAAMAGGLAILPAYILDVTEPNRARLDEDTLIVIGPVTAPALVGDDRSVFVGQPAAPIAAGATGACSLIAADGTIVATSVQVTNVDPTNAWPANQRNYVVVDEITGLFIGLPSCTTPDSAWSPPAATTTTPFPCAAIVAATMPVGFV